MSAAVNRFFLNRGSGAKLAPAAAAPVDGGRLHPLKAGDCRRHSPSPPPRLISGGSMTITYRRRPARDAHQSLFATRLRLDDMLPIAAQLDDVGYGSLECWGGAATTPASASSAKTRGCLRELKRPCRRPADAAARQNLLGYRRR